MWRRDAVVRSRRSGRHQRARPGVLVQRRIGAVAVPGHHDGLGDHAGNPGYGSAGRSPAGADRSDTTGGLLAALIAAESFVGVRDWFNVAGSAGVNLSSLADVVTLAAGSGLAGTIATATVTVAVWPDATASRSRQPMWVSAGLIATATPIVLITARDGSFTATAIGAVFISPSLPCAAAVALAGICRRDLRLALLATAALILTSVAATSLI